MQYRRLGKTGLEVSEIGFGAWGIGKFMWRGGSDQESMQALHKAVDLGINLIDTALVYGNGHSEKLVGQLLRERSEQLVVATKIPPKNLKWPARGTLDEVFPSSYMVSCVEKSLSNLGVDQIDLLQLHVWNPEWLHQDEWRETVSDLQQRGKVRFFGVSVNDHDPESAVALVRSGKVDTVQVIFNIFDQSPEDRLFPACLEMDVGVLARVPFDEGSLTGGVTPETTFPQKDWRNLYFTGDRKQQVFERVSRLTDLLGKEAQKLPELALKYCLHTPAVSTVIPGMRSTNHVIENTSTSDGRQLSSEMLDRLREHRWVRNFYPEA